MAAALGRRRWVTPVVALAAVGVLVVMVASGHLRENQQLVRTTAAGVMTEVPAEIDRIELHGGAGQWSFVRTPDGWRRAGHDPVSASLAGHLNDSIKFMHVSAPIRVMERAEWTSSGLREFGLDPPGYTAALYRHDAPVVIAEFGASNPQQVLQYMKLHGRDEVYLMSRFVGEEWEQALREAAGR
ncbi:MAG TPA: hypothetical protein VHT71_18475 [Methylomirabilota bacterium]|nr:hypothetical protein [Methylomirabilota bacterium]